jgi:hypothetical protein
MSRIKYSLKQRHSPGGFCEESAVATTWDGLPTKTSSWADEWSAVKTFSDQSTSTFIPSIERGVVTALGIPTDDMELLAAEASVPEQAESHMEQPNRRAATVVWQGSEIRTEEAQEEEDGKPSEPEGLTEDGTRDRGSSGWRLTKPGSTEAGEEAKLGTAIKEFGSKIADVTNEDPSQEIGTCRQLEVCPEAGTGVSSNAVITEDGFEIGKLTIVDSVQDTEAGCRPQETDSNTKLAGPFLLTKEGQSWDSLRVGHR